MNLQWIENVRAEFARIYGEKRGLAACNAVIPGVVGDFRKTVLAAENGASVTEEYRTDDRRAVIRVTGVRRGSACVITGIEVDGRAVALGADELTL